VRWDQKEEEDEEEMGKKRVNKDSIEAGEGKRELMVSSLE
jgi:hypothetical protein